MSICWSHTLAACNAASTAPTEDFIWPQDLPSPLRCTAKTTSLKTDSFRSSIKSAFKALSQGLSSAKLHETMEATMKTLQKKRPEMIMLADTVDGSSSFALKAPGSMTNGSFVFRLRERETRCVLERVPFFTKFQIRKSQPTNR
jgi:hypothetical protein